MLRRLEETILPVFPCLGSLKKWTDRHRNPESGLKENYLENKEQRPAGIRTDPAGLLLLQNKRFDNV